MVSRGHGEIQRALLGVLSGNYWEPVGGLADWVTMVKFMRDVPESEDRIAAAVGAGFAFEGSVNGERVAVSKEAISTAADRESVRRALRRLQAEGLVEITYRTGSPTDSTRPTRRRAFVRLRRAPRPPGVPAPL